MEVLNKKNFPLYSEMAYDDAFRTMEGRCDDLLIPFVSHMFKENYDKTAVVKRLRNEHFVEHENGSEEKRITDSYFDIIHNNITKKYHLECESKKYDGTLLVRIFEYGSQIAKDEYSGDLFKARFQFPNTGLLLLKSSSKNAPDSAALEIEMPNGKVTSLDVPIIKMANYTVDVIFEKQLFMLIPFYIFNYEEKLSEINTSDELVNRLMDDFNEIFTRLEKELELGNLSALSYDAIIRLTYSVAYKLTMKKDRIQKKVGDVMGGKVLDLPGFRLYDQGLEQGIEQGIRVFIEDKLEDNVPVDLIKKKISKRFKIGEEKAEEYIASVMSSHS